MPRGRRKIYRSHLALLLQSLHLQSRNYCHELWQLQMVLVVAAPETYGVFLQVMYLQATAFVMATQHVLLTVMCIAQSARVLAGLSCIQQRHAQQPSGPLPGHNVAE